MSQFVIINGKVAEKNEINLSHLFWKDKIVVSQKIWFGFGGIPLFAENIGLLIQQIDTLRLPCPDLLKNQNELFRITKRMLNKNRYYRSGYLYFQIFWQENELNMMISGEPSDQFDFPLSARGILVNFSEIKKLSKNGNFQSLFFNHTFWKIVSAQNRGTYFQNSIILNESPSICEAIFSNLYIINGETLYTPSLQTGCFGDTLREIIIEIASDLGFKIAEPDNLTKEDVFGADELFIAGEVVGIQWILGVENKRFVHKHSEEIHLKLNSYLKEKAHK